MVSCNPAINIVLTFSRVAHFAEPLMRQTEMVPVQLLNVTFVLIAAGQSNTHYGFNLERIRDSFDFSRMLQIPSHLATNNPPVIPVREPLVQSI